MTSVLVCGISTRAIAESAARAGFHVTAIDGYADLDQHPSVRALSMPRDFASQPTASAIARAARTLGCDAVVYLSPFENHPRAVASLAIGRALWGNRPDVLRAVRDPQAVAAVLRRNGFAVPRVTKGPAVTGANVQVDPNVPDDTRAPNDSNVSNDPNVPNAVLVKPLRSGGGHRIHPWSGGRVPSGTYLQQRIDGTPGSVVFLAAAGKALPLAVTRQLVGDAAFGASGYRYCGSVVSAAPDLLFSGGAQIADVCHRLCDVMAAEFELVGLNGIDFIARDGVPYPIEVNPRWSSSLELVERLIGQPLFAAHAEACARGALSARDIDVPPQISAAVGKAIVFARHDVVAGETDAWLGDDSVRDVPHPGERINAGQPICSVFATGNDFQSCYAALVARAERVYREFLP